MPALDTEAPDIELNDQAGRHVRLRDLRGQWVVVYFYPKDDTPGCTKEACDFRDNYGAIRAAGATVLGISSDSAASHAKFASKYELPFTLLVDDADDAVARAYGAFGMKKNYGKEYEGVIRSTFIVNPQGRIAKIWASVKPDQHGAQVLDWLKANAAA
ncbi:MAG: thioredoxin-dependent thiol peroxidase [Chloroflexi bacterium]|nr:thioredoxin-dependent thiol peroxidase [Chloroflexota bacterium]